MPKTRAIRFGPPWMGKVARTAYADQPRPSIYSSLNFWPYDAKTGRDRLAVCPGYKLAGTSISGGSAITGVNMLGTLDLAVSGDEDSPEITPTTYGRQLMAASGGSLYKSSTGLAYTLVSPSDSAAVDTGRNVQTTSLYRWFFIANTTNAYAKYDYNDNSFSLWVGSTSATIPKKCPLICTWDNRIVLAGNVNQPHVVNFSRIDEPGDWDFGQQDQGAAVAVPNINQPITALMPHGQRCLVVGTYNSMWVFSGNPTNGGHLYRLDTPVGPINATAWCHDENGRMWLLTRKGLYSMAGPCGSTPVPVSTNVIPESLLALDGVNDKAYLAYDTRFRCVHIYVTGSNAQYFHYFPPQSPEDPGGFYPVSTPGTSLLALGRYDVAETADASGLLIGNSSDLKRLDRTQDVGSAGHVKLLFPMAEPGYKSMISEAHVVFGDNTEDTTGVVAFYGAENAEDVVAEPTGRKFSTTITAIQSNRHRCFPRVGGQAGLFAITQTDTSDHISVEGITLYTSPIGKERG